MKILTSHFVFAVLALCLQIQLCCGIKDFVRRLFGSNCIQIERGSVPKYYTCLGCRIEEAVGCIDDMRRNHSGNVAHNCDMAMVTEHYESDRCCPTFHKERNGRLNLNYVGSAYPEALRCIESVGCHTSNIYLQLLDECYAMCPPEDYLDQNGKSSCFANFNAATPSNQFKLSSFSRNLCVALITLVCLLQLLI